MIQTHELWDPVQCSTIIINRRRCRRRHHHHNNNNYNIYRGYHQANTKLIRVVLYLHSDYTAPLSSLRAPQNLTESCWYFVVLTAEQPNTENVFPQCPLLIIARFILWHAEAAPTAITQSVKYFRLRAIGLNKSRDRILPS